VSDGGEDQGAEEGTVHGVCQERIVFVGFGSRGEAGSPFSAIQILNLRGDGGNGDLRDAERESAREKMRADMQKLISNADAMLSNPERNHRKTKNLEPGDRIMGATAHSSEAQGPVASQAHPALPIAGRAASGRVTGQNSRARTCRNREMSRTPVLTGLTVTTPVRRAEWMCRRRSFSMAVHSGRIILLSTMPSISARNAASTWVGVGVGVAVRVRVRVRVRVARVRVRAQLFIFFKGIVRHPYCDC